MHLQLSGRYTPQMMVPQTTQMMAQQQAPQPVAVPQITEHMIESIVPSRQEQQAQAQQSFNWSPYDGTGFAPVW